VDFDEVWAPVSRHAPVRAFLATVAHRGWEVNQVDVTTAFLYGDLEGEDVYMEMPPGFGVTGTVCKLRKCIYGLRQAPRAWYFKLKRILEEIGLRPGTADPTLWFGKGVMVLLYVDDALIAGWTREAVEHVKQALGKFVKLRDLKEARSFLSLSIERGTASEGLSRFTKRATLRIFSASSGWRTTRRALCP
jgi:hypothetical protein